MNRGTKILIEIAAFAALTVPVLAQTAVPAPPAPTPAPPAGSPNQPNPNRDVTMRQRDKREAKRIAQGVDNGNLTQKEATQLKTEDRKISKEEYKMKAADGGKLSAADRAKVEKQQNRLSHQIRNEKRDNARNKK